MDTPQETLNAADQELLGRHKLYVEYRKLLETEAFLSWHLQAEQQAAVELLGVIGNKVNGLPFDAGRLAALEAQWHYINFALPRIREFCKNHEAAMTDLDIQRQLDKLTGNTKPTNPLQAP